eukprot:143994-Chlamydomonas_euryale.AAC.1
MHPVGRKGPPPQALGRWRGPSAGRRAAKLPGTRRSRGRPAHRQRLIQQAVNGEALAPRRHGVGSVGVEEGLGHRLIAKRGVERVDYALERARSLLAIEAGALGQLLPPQPPQPPLPPPPPTPPQPLPLPR